MCFSGVYGDCGHLGFPHRSFQGSMRLTKCPSLNNHNWSHFQEKLWSMKKSDQFNSQLKCTSVFPWDNYSTCSRGALSTLPMLMHWILDVYLRVKGRSVLILRNAIVWYSMEKCASIWNTCIIHWAPVFQVANAWCCRIPSKWKIN